MRKTQKLNRKKLNNIEKFDIIISGSDQIWNPQIYGGELDTIFLLDFETRATKISYASSLGSYKIDDKDARLFKRCLNNYSKISVREEFAIEQLKKLGINNIAKVCDPTMLLTCEEWKSFLPKNYKKITQEKYVVVYLMSKYEEYMEEIKDIAEFYKLKIVLVTFSNLKRKYVDYYAKGYDPLEFLKILEDSELVITNSFHGTVFSLLFNKEFINLENKKNPERVKNLLEMVHLKDRIVTHESNLKEKIIKMRPIDYEKVNIIIEEFANESRCWLKNAVKE